MMARPRRKSRELTQPGPTTYSRRSGVTTGPPPKMRVPARKKLLKRERAKGGVVRVLRRMITRMRRARVVARIRRPWRQVRMLKVWDWGIMRSVVVVEVGVVGSMGWRLAGVALEGGIEAVLVRVSVSYTHLTLPTKRIV